MPRVDPCRCEHERGNSDDLGGVVEAACEAGGTGGQPVQPVQGQRGAAPGWVVCLAFGDGAGLYDRKGNAG
jgi:hypothetical protein